MERGDLFSVETPIGELWFYRNLTFGEFIKVSDCLDDDGEPIPDRLPDLVIAIARDGSGQPALTKKDRGKFLTEFFAEDMVALIRELSPIFLSMAEGVAEKK